MTAPVVRIVDPEGSALTLRARYDNGTWWWQAGIGPGVGPHEGRTTTTLRQWADALWDLADHIDTEQTRHNNNNDGTGLDELEPLTLFGATP